MADEITSRSAKAFVHVPRLSPTPHTGTVANTSPQFFLTFNIVNYITLNSAIFSISAADRSSISAFKIATTIQLSY